MLCDFQFMLYSEAWGGFILSLNAYARRVPVLADPTSQMARNPTSTVNQAKDHKNIHLVMSRRYL